MIAPHVFSRWAAFAAADEAAGDLHGAYRHHEPADPSMHLCEQPLARRVAINQIKPEQHQAKTRPLECPVHMPPPGVIHLCRPVLARQHLEKTGCQCPQRQQKTPGQHHTSGMPHGPWRDVMLALSHQRRAQPVHEQVHGAAPRV